MLGHGLGEGLRLQTAGVTAVAVVGLRRRLRARHADLVRVDDDHEIARVHVRRVLRLVLALEDLRGLGGNAAEHLVRRVDQDPLALNFEGFRVIRLHCLPPYVRPTPPCGAGTRRPKTARLPDPPRNCGDRFQKCRSIGCRVPTPARNLGPGLPRFAFPLLAASRGF